MKKNNMAFLISGFVNIIILSIIFWIVKFKLVEINLINTFIIAVVFFVIEGIKAKLIEKYFKL